DRMSQAVSVGQPPPGRWLLLSGVDWRMYTRLLRAFAERPGIRLTYDRGALEILTLFTPPSRFSPGCAACRCRSSGRARCDRRAAARAPRRRAVAGARAPSAHK